MKLILKIKTFEKKQINQIFDLLKKIEKNQLIQKSIIQESFSVTKKIKNFTINKTHFVHNKAKTNFQSKIYTIKTQYNCTNFWIGSILKILLERNISNIEQVLITK